MMFILKKGDCFTFSRFLPLLFQSPLNHFVTPLYVINSYYLYPGFLRMDLKRILGKSQGVSYK